MREHGLKLAERLQKECPKYRRISKVSYPAILLTLCRPSIGQRFGTSLGCGSIAPQRLHIEMAQKVIRERMGNEEARGSVADPAGETGSEANWEGRGRFGECTSLPCPRLHGRACIRALRPGS